MHRFGEGLGIVISVGEFENEQKVVGGGGGGGGGGERGCFHP